MRMTPTEKPSSEIVCLVDDDPWCSDRPAFYSPRKDSSCVSLIKARISLLMWHHAQPENPIDHSGFSELLPWRLRPAVPPAAPALRSCPVRALPRIRSRPHYKMAGAGIRIESFLAS